MRALPFLLALIETTALQGTPSASQHRYGTDRSEETKTLEEKEPRVKIGALETER